MKLHHTASSPTDCSDQALLFQALGSRQVVADFSGGTLSTDGGVLLLRQVERRLGLSRALAECFDDHRDPRFVDHQLPELLAQRVVALALGYEDLNDHDVLRDDVLLAAASNAVVIGFNVRPESKAQAAAEREHVDIRTYRIIYEAVDDVRAAMEGLLAPTLKEQSLGRAEVRQVFMIPRIGAVAGSYVSQGVITRASSGVRVVRDGIVVYQGKLGSLRRFKDDVREVQTGYECGIGVENFNDIKVGDVLEAFTIEKIAAKL